MTPPPPSPGCLGVLPALPALGQLSAPLGANYWRLEGRLFGGLGVQDQLGFEPRGTALNRSTRDLGRCLACTEGLVLTSLRWCLTH